MWFLDEGRKFSGLLLGVVSGNGFSGLMDDDVNYLTEVNRRVTLDTFVKGKGYYRGKKKVKGENLLRCKRQGAKLHLSHVFIITYFKPSIVEINNVTVMDLHTSM